MKIIYLFFILVIISSGCRKEQDLLTGEIMGKIIVVNEDYSKAQDRSDVTVSLLKDSTILSTTLTDTHGQYHFENISYGKYTIDIQKDGYLKAYGIYPIYHVGGYSPTLMDGSVYELPSFELTIDSIQYITDSYEIKVYLKVNGSGQLPYDYYFFRGYCSSTPDVSKDNFASMVGGYLRQSEDVPEVPVAPYGIITNFDNKFHFEKNSTVYIRLYPLAFGQGYFLEFNTKALGKPSNIISFKMRK